MRAEAIGGETMTDLQSTLDAIDAAIGCQQCGGPMGASPSRDFCDDICQDAWCAARSEPLVGYREPYDLAAHVSNQKESHSPETTPSGMGRVVEHQYEYAVGYNTRPMFDKWRPSAAVQSLMRAYRRDRGGI